MVPIVEEQLLLILMFQLQELHINISYADIS